MTKVYIVFENTKIQGVYSTKEKAEEYTNDLELSTMIYDEVYISEYDVDQED